MTRKIMSDIIISKKSIRHIPLPETKKIKYKQPVVVEDVSEDYHLEETTRIPNNYRRPANPTFAIWFIAILCLMALFFGVSVIFSSATVTLTPRIQTITFNDDTYTVRSTVSSSTELGFEVLNVKQVLGKTVEATEEKEVSQKASGTIIIYNNYSTVSQRLINNTRFEANNGMVYRINSSVVVPGMKKSGDNTVTPGSVEAVVYADQPGDSYNLKVVDLKGDFTIPGFKGDPRFQGFYARMKTDFTGGFVGKQRVVSESVRGSVEDSIKTELREQLLKQLYAIIPENYIMLSDGYSIDFTSAQDTVVDKNNIQINIEGNLSGIVFNNLKLAKYLAENKLTDFDSQPVQFIPGDNLRTVFKGQTGVSLDQNKSLDITLNGDATIKWVYDATALRKDLAGKKESDLKVITAKYGDSVVTLKVIFRPVWTRYFPDDPDKIKIEESLLD